MSTVPPPPELAKDRTRPDEPPVPWGAVAPFVIVAAAIVVFGVVGFVLQLSGVADLGEPGAADEPAFTWLSLVEFPLLVAFVAVCLRFRHPGQAWLLLGHRRFRAVHLLAGVGLGVAALLVVDVPVGLLVDATAGEQMPEIQEGMREALLDPASAVPALLAIVVIAPVAEEILFRGLLFQGLRRRLSFPAAAVVSSVLFAAVHIEPTLVGSLFVGTGAFLYGMLYAWLLHRYGTLWLPIAAHAARNGVVALLVLAGAAAGVAP
jgi:uncharacterized protein